MAHDAIATCPICSGELAVTRLHCRACGTTLEGDFNVGRFARLSREQFALLESFLRSRGNLKEMERELGISYPTVRARVDALLRALGPRRRRVGGGRARHGGRACRRWGRRRHRRGRSPSRRPRAPRPAGDRPGDRGSRAARSRRAEMADERTTTEPTSGPRVHDIGAGGIVVVAAEAADVRIHGVQGTEVRVVAPADGAGIVTEAQPGRFTVRTLRQVGSERVAFVGLKVGRREFGFPLGFRVSGTIEIEVPRNARVEVGVAAGDVAIRDVLGGAAVRSASGDVSIKGAGGHVTVNASSGDVNVIAAEPVTLEVHSVAGDVRARAPRFDRVAVETISGDAEVTGTFAATARHAISTVSGDVELNVLSGGLAIEVKTVSGDLTATTPTAARATVGGGRSSSATAPRRWPSAPCPATSTCARAGWPLRRPRRPRPRSASSTGATAGHANAGPWCPGCRHDHDPRGARPRRDRRRRGGAAARDRQRAG